MENILSLIASGNNVSALELLKSRGLFPNSEVARDILKKLELKRKELQGKCQPLDLQSYFTNVVVEDSDADKALYAFSANVRLWEDTVDAYRKEIQ